MIRTLFFIFLLLPQFLGWAATFSVSTTDDSGPGSFRQAILDANAAEGQSMITFGVSGVITLTSPLPVVTGSTVISGPGTNVLTVSGNNSVQILAVGPSATVQLSGLTIVDGMAAGYANGAGISNAGNLTISSCVLAHNRTFGGWGGGVFNAGHLTVLDSVFIGNQVVGENGAAGGPNSSGGGGGAGLGGGLFTMSGVATLARCSFASNSATGGNGGVLGGGTSTGRGGGVNGGGAGQAGGGGHPGQNGGTGGGGGGGSYCTGAGAGGIGGGGGGGGSCNVPNPGGGGGLGGGPGGTGGPCGGPGGGGGGLGGGTFVQSGRVTLVDCEFTANQVSGGLVGAHNLCADPGGNGGGVGPDLFNNAGIMLPALTGSTAGGGSVMLEPPAPPYLNQSSATATAIPASGWTMLEWRGDAAGTNTSVGVHMSRDKFVQAVFATSISVSPSISVFPESDLYPFGTKVKFTAFPPPNSCFLNWTEGAAGSNNPITFAVTNSNQNISCQFGALSLGETTITVIENGDGHVFLLPIKNPQYRFLITETAGLIAIPDPGQQFIGWSGDSTGTQNPLLVSMIQTRVITANFTKRPALRVGTPLEGLVDEGFRLTVSGEFGGHFAILSSTNLADWTRAGTLTNTYGTSQFTDPAATNLSRSFYRALTN